MGRQPVECIRILLLSCATRAASSAAAVSCTLSLADAMRRSSRRLPRPPLPAWRLLCMSPLWPAKVRPPAFRLPPPLPLPSPLSVAHGQRRSTGLQEFAFHRVALVPCGPTFAVREGSSTLNGGHTMQTVAFA
eukprot:224033-Chlamydomonas_euryale.AAC.1